MLRYGFSFVGVEERFVERVYYIDMRIMDLIKSLPAFVSVLYLVWKITWWDWISG